MKRSSIVAVAIALIIGLAGCASTGVSQADYDSLKERYDSLKQDFDEISDKYAESLHEKMENIETRDIIFSAAATTIDENADCTILNDDIIQITIPIGNKTMDEISDSMEGMGYAIGVALDGSDFKSCLILFVNDNGLCSFGLSVLSDGTVSSFSDATNPVK